MKAKILRFLMLTSSAIVVVGVFAVVLFAGAVLSFFDTTKTNEQSHISIVSTEIETVCPSAIAVDDDLSNDEEFGATKTPPDVKTNVAAYGGVESVDFEKVEGNGESINSRIAQDWQNLSVGSDKGSEAKVFLAKFQENPAITGVAGVVNERTKDGDLKGLATAQCVSASNEFWFVGGDTKLGTTSELVLTNVTDSAAAVEFSVWGDNEAQGQTSSGELKYSASNVTGVNAHSEQRILLGSGASDQGALVVHVKASQSPVSATLAVRKLSGITPGGVDYADPSSNPAKTQTLLGVQRSTDLQILSFDKNQTVKATFYNSISNTNSDEEGAQNSAPKPISHEFEVKGSIVSHNKLDFLPDGVYTVTLESDENIIAGGTTNVKFEDGTSEFGLLSSTVQRRENFIAVGEQEGAYLVLYAPKKTKVAISYFASDGSFIGNKEYALAEGQTTLIPRSDLSTEDKTFAFANVITSGEDSSAYVSAILQGDGFTSATNSVDVTPKTRDFDIGYKDNVK